MAVHSETGVIFNIQKFSLHDGPGIRTVVFCKGCPLRCKWCSNPESQSGNIQILWDREKCLACGGCEGSCPEKAVSRSASGIDINRDRCTACGLCAAACPGRALKAEGESKTVESALAQCLRDRAFYEESGGGVTLSGGEPLAQPGFTLALLKALRAEGIHTAVETTGFAAPEIFREALGYLDLVLFDMKHWDEARHREGTGVSNRLPLENMGEAIAAGVPLLPRVPVIPGYNDSLRDAEGFSRLLKETGAGEVQLLPFHQFGERKYELLGLNYAFAGVAALHEEELAEYQQVFLERGIRAFF